MEYRHVALTAQSAINATWRVVLCSRNQDPQLESRRTGASVAAAAAPALRAGAYSKPNAETKEDSLLHHDE